jgi:hypothetical protein
LSDRQSTAFNLRQIGTALTLGIVAQLTAPPAKANPALARMTGHTCAVCHVPAQEPLLNATGNEFKSCGFSFCKGPPSPEAEPFPQTRARPAVPPVIRENEIEETTVLGHNGSTILMKRKGNRLTMTYSGVRPGLSVPDGSTLFKGTITDENEINGVAYTFKRGCSPAAYDVNGMQTDRTIELRGPAPVRDPSGCETVDFDASLPSARLHFDISE